MPINASPHYFKAEARYRDAKKIDEKIYALEEMIRTAPKHKGAENLLAQLKSKLARLKKESVKKSKKTSRSSRLGIKKEGDAQVCMLGLPNSGKSWLLSKLTNAKPVISEYYYTTSKPEVGMMNYNGINIQIIEIPATFQPRFMSIARTAELVVLLIKDDEEKKKMKNIIDYNFLRTKHIFVNAFKEDPKKIKEKIWSNLNLIIVFTKTRHDTAKQKGTPMALQKGATIRDFAGRIHKDFIKNFRFARILRNNRPIQAGLKYKLKNNDIVELHTR
ncbi:GTPase [Candidatus Aenigmatarchaeota archaeon]